MNVSAKPRILITDDEPNIRLAIDFLMKQAGYETAMAQNGFETLQIIKDFRPNVLILDVMMPDMTGFEAAMAIRKQEMYESVNIIFLTAKGTDKDKLKGYGAGGDLYLTKPFDNDELVELVHDVLTYG